MQLKHMIKTGVTSLALVSLSRIVWAADDTNSLAVLKSMSLEDLGQVQVNTVVAASKYEQKTTDAPASVSIITQDEIKRYGYRTLADILGSVQGFYVSNDRDYSSVGVRGMSLGDGNSRVLVLIDGHRMNGNLSDSAFVGTEFMLDVDLIERVEIIRGPGSVLYGNNAFFAVINVITRKGGQVNGVEGSGEYGNFETYKGRFTAGKSFTNGAAFLLSGTYYHSAGQDQIFFPQYNTPAQNHGVARNMDGDWYGSWFGSLSFWDLMLEGGFIHREKVNPTAQSLTTFNDPRLRTMDEDGYADLKYTHDFAGLADVAARLYYDHDDATGGYPYGSSPGGKPSLVEYLTGEAWGAELQLNKKLWDKDMISAGAEYRDDFTLGDHLVDPSRTYKKLQNLHSSRQNDGVFAQGDFALLDTLHLNGGVRLDQYEGFDPFYSPRLALIYHPLDQSTFKAIYGTAFRAPSFEEQTALVDQINHHIQPESIESYELDYEQGIGPHLRSSVAGFYNHMDDLILYQNGAYGNVNAESKGMELALEGNWANGVSGRASYTLERTENLTRGGGFPNSPEHLVKLNLSVPLLKEKLFASLEAQYLSSRHTIYTVPATAATAQGVDTPGFPTLNFTIFSKQIVKNLEVSASVYNLLDQAYSDPATQGHLEAQIPQAGRSFWLKLTYRY